MSNSTTATPTASGLPAAATAPTMYFVGVTTGGSAIHDVFRAWKPLLGIPDAELVGIDLPLDADPDSYREVVEFIGADPLSQGALVTTHKLRLYAAAQQLFSSVNADALALGEVSCLVSTADGVAGLALDAVTSGLALAAVTDDLAGRNVLIMGAGGAALALSSYLAGLSQSSAPSAVTVTDISQANLDTVRDHVADSGSGIRWAFEILQPEATHDALLAALPPGALIVNATGKGKDRPGSPLSDDAVFPQDAIAWEFNYRGSLEFVHQAEAQRDSRGVQVHDGWIYFVHGWTRAIANVFAIDIPTAGPGFDALADAAKGAR